MTNEHKKKGERADLKERLCQAFDLSPDLLPGGFSVNIRGKNQVSIEGSGKILHYTPERVSVRVSGGSVTISGRRLCCVSYLAGAVEIQGRIDAVYLEEEQGESKR